MNYETKMSEGNLFIRVTRFHQQRLLLFFFRVLIDAYRSGSRQAFNIGATEATKDISLLF